MKINVLVTPFKREFHSPEIEVIPVRIQEGFLVSNEPPQNEHTHEEDLF